MSTNDTKSVTVQPHILFLRTLDYAILMLREDGTPLRSAVAEDLLQLRNVITSQPFEVWERQWRFRAALAEEKKG